MWWTSVVNALILLLAVVDAAAAIRCYTCANEFIVWNWRHLFLKRNYAISQSDKECTRHNYLPDMSKKCSSSCFMMYLNGTDRTTGRTVVLGVGRGCSAQFLTNEQYMSKSLGVQSKPSDISKYLNQAYGQLDIWEHWCFCATDECNTDSCFAQWQYAYHPQHRNRHYNFDFYEPSYWGTSYNHAGHAIYSTIFSSLLPLVFIAFMALF